MNFTHHFSVEMQRRIKYYLADLCDELHDYVTNKNDKWIVKNAKFVSETRMRMSHETTCLQMMEHNNTYHECVSDFECVIHDDVQEVIDIQRQVVLLSKTVEEYFTFLEQRSKVKK